MQDTIFTPAEALAIMKLFRWGKDNPVPSIDAYAHRHIFILDRRDYLPDEEYKPGLFAQSHRLEKFLAAQGLPAHLLNYDLAWAAHNVGAAHLMDGDHFVFIAVHDGLQQNPATMLSNLANTQISTVSGTTVARLVNFDLAQKMLFSVSHIDDRGLSRKHAGANQLRFTALRLAMQLFIEKGDEETARHWDVALGMRPLATGLPTEAERDTVAPAFGIYRNHGLLLHEAARAARLQLVANEMGLLIPPSDLAALWKNGTPSPDITRIETAIAKREINFSRHEVVMPMAHRFALQEDFPPRLSDALIAITQQLDIDGYASSPISIADDDFRAALGHIILHNYISGVDRFAPDMYRALREERGPTHPVEIATLRRSDNILN